MNEKIRKGTIWLVLCMALAVVASIQPHCLAAGPAKAKAAPVLEGVVNLNTATETELTRLPRVGETVARRIIAFRDQHGPFTRAEELMNVQGIGEKTFDRLRPHLAVEGETTLREVPAAGE
jgi:competence protein ComEA